MIVACVQIGTYIKQNTLVVSPKVECLNFRDPILRKNRRFWEHSELLVLAKVVYRTINPTIFIFLSLVESEIYQTDNKKTKK